jgi:hypothetical protein
VAQLLILGDDVRITNGTGEEVTNRSAYGFDHPTKGLFNESRATSQA